MERDENSGEARFEIVRLLGEGANGKVFHVRDLFNQGKELALKVLVHSDVLDKHTRERFIKEILILSSIEHKNIVTAYEIVDYEGKDAYTMELVKGANLNHYLSERRAGSISAKQIDSIMQQLLFAVGELHRRQIIHRDIKLENIMLREDGTVKLNDMGLAKILNENARTDPGLILGTAHYLSPEYVLNKGIDHRTDLYACGMILWELLNGKRRYTEENGELILTELIAANFKHPMPELEGEKKKYAAILNKALAYDPNNRYSTADEMRKVFEEKPVMPKYKPQKNNFVTYVLIFIVSCLILGFLISKL